MPPASDNVPCRGCGWVPEPIDAAVRWRVLTQPTHYKPFLWFCCGKTRRSEHEVSVTIHNLWADRVETPQVAVVLEKDSAPEKHTGQRPLVGVATVVKDPTPLEVPGVPGLQPADLGALIGVIGTDLVYRGRPLKDGKSRPGSALLEGTLEVIQSRFRGSMPFVKAHVLPDNTGSKQLFDQHHFDNLGLGGGAGGDQLILFRAPLVPVASTRALTWAV
jgi:hypothetical protein